MAKLYQVDWRLFELDPAMFEDALELLHMKNGLNYLAMSFILPFCGDCRTFTATT